MTCLLPLSGFTCIFQIFCGYYLIIGTNSKYSDYLGIRRLFNDKKVEDLPDNISNILSYSKYSDDSVPDNLSKLKKKIGVDYKELEPKLNKVFHLIKIHFNSARIDKQEQVYVETNFMSFYRSIYIIFGLLAMNLLVLAGMENRVSVHTELSIINIACIFILIYSLIFYFRSVNKRKEFIPTSIPGYLVVTCIIFLALDAFTNLYCNKFPNQIIEYFGPKFLTFEETQVIIVNILLICPSIMHLLFMQILKYKIDNLPMEKIKELEKNIGEYKNGIDLFDISYIDTSVQSLSGE